MRPVLLSTLLGLGLGWVGAGLRAPPPVVVPVQDPPAPTPQRRCQSLGPDTPLVDNCPAIELAGRWCTAQVATLTAERPEIRLGFEDLPPELGPDAFEAALDAALADCGLPMDDVVVNCDRFPCVASARARVTEGGPDLAQSLKDCEDLPGGLGPVHLTWPVTCPDGSVELMEQLALLPQEPDLANFGLPEEELDGIDASFFSMRPFFYFYGHLGVRSGDLAADWRCR